MSYKFLAEVGIGSMQMVGGHVIFEAKAVVCQRAM
jgi:hypothetical protein